MEREDFVKVNLKYIYIYILKNNNKKTQQQNTY